MVVVALSKGQPVPLPMHHSLDTMKWTRLARAAQIEITTVEPTVTTTLGSATCLSGTMTREPTPL